MSFLFFLLRLLDLFLCMLEGGSLDSAIGLLTTFSAWCDGTFPFVTASPFGIVPHHSAAFRADFQGGSNPVD